MARNGGLHRYAQGYVGCLRNSICGCNNSYDSKVRTHSKSLRAEGQIGWLFGSFISVPLTHMRYDQIESSVLSFIHFSILHALYIQVTVHPSLRFLATLSMTLPYSRPRPQSQMASLPPASMMSRFPHNREGEREGGRPGRHREDSIGERSAQPDQGVGGT